MQLLTRWLLLLVQLWWLELFNHVDEPRVLVLHIIADRIDLFARSGLLRHEIGLPFHKALQDPVQELAIVVSRRVLLH